MALQRTLISDKLSQFNIDISDIVLGEFDQIAVNTAYRTRTPDAPEYKKAGFLYRPNLERGIFQYYLIQKYGIKSVLEMGTGRGYSAICCAKAMHDAGIGIDGQIVTIDAGIDSRFVEQLKGGFPQEWMSKIHFILGKTQSTLPTIQQDFDFVYIDAAHDYQSVLSDWTWAKDHFSKFVLFDDYDLEQHNEINVKKVIDEIDEEEYNLEWLIMDRRLFADDRRLKDEEINYGQVLVSRK